MDDRNITDQVKSELKSDPVYRFDDVDVQTFAGIVQLSGFATTEAQKQRATQLAQTVPGVMQVKNVISMKPQPLEPTGRTNAAPMPSKQ
jgi:osmotically-inducible protein OsmY